MSGTSYNVTNENGLNAAILAIDAASVTAPAGTAYTIVIADDLTLNSDIAAISLASGTSLSISGNDPSSGNSSAQIDGNNSYRGFVALSGAVTLDSLGLSNMQATGGRGGNGAQAGGGGAGLGGAVFVGSGADVLLSNDTISGNAAVGGGGGAKTGAGIGAGGSGEPGGFGAGGAGGVAGGFGGGGGAGAAGGFGAGSNAGGGLGAGGNIFVQQGGQLNFASGTADGGSVQGGSGGGHGYGGDIFIQGGTTITLGNTSIAGNITDQSGSGGTGLNAGAGAVLVNGSVTLSGADTYTGGTTIAGSLTLAAPGAAGSGEISFLSGTLAIGLHDTPTNLIGNFVTSDVIDLKSIGLETTASLSSGNVLTISGGSGGAVSLNLDPTQNYANDAFILQSDGAKGTALTVTQTHFYVGSESDLNAALAEIDVGGVYVAPKTAYTITFTAGFTLNTDLNAINLAHGDTLTINGAGNVLDGGGQYRGFFVYGGQVALQNLTIQNAMAAGGAGGAGSAPGAGGAGLGGGLYVGAGTGVSLSNVSFLNDSAVGGAAGAVAGAGNGGGGGMGGAGGASLGHSGGGGGVGTGATGGAYGVAAAGAGILIGAGAGGFGTGSGAGAGGANGGGGGIAGVFSGSGRDPRSFPGTAGAGGVSNAANFGGGAGSGQLAGFGGGGASPANADGGNSAGGLGGWGGGGSGAAGGLGGGSGAAGGAGGGLGAGGAVFVQTGGTLILQSGAEQGGAAAGGAGSGGGGNGAAYGAGLFLQGGNSLNLAPGAGQSLTISDVIADSKGVTNTGGQVAVVMNGAGTATLAASNAYSGGTTLSGGTLALLAPGAAGSGAITFAYGHAASLVVGSGDTPLNVLRFFLPGDVIDLQGIGTASSAILGTGDVLAVTGGTVPVNLSLYTGQNFTGETFAVASDKQGGTLLTAVTAGNDQPPSISGSAVGGTDHAAFAPLKGVAITDLNAGQTESVTLQLSSTKNGGLGNLSGGSYNVATGVYTVSGSAAAVTSALQGLVFTPTEYQAVPGAVVYTNFNLSVTDGTMIAAAPLLVGVKALNDVPVVSGGVSQQDAYWNVPVNAFAGVTIADPDAKASESVTLTVGSYSGGPNGTLSLASPVDGISLTNTATGTYTLTAGSPGAVTAALDAVMFTPTTTDPNAGFTITNLGVSVSDGIAAPVTGANITVYAGLPIITGTQAGQVVADTAKIAPFSTVQISDSAYFTQESVTILLTNAAGNATDANGTLAGAGLSKAGTGIYTLASGSPIAVSSALDALVFSPSAVAAGQTVTTNFTLEVFDGATTSDNGNTSVIASGPGAMAFLRPASMTAPAFGFTSAVHGALTAADFAPRGADGCMFQPVVSAWEGNSAGMAQADNGLFAASGHAQIIATTPLDHARAAAHAA